MLIGIPVELRGVAMFLNNKVILNPLRNKDEFTEEQLRLFEQFKKKTDKTLASQSHVEQW
jgi:hypothetical protein